MLTHGSASMHACVDGCLCGCVPADVSRTILLLVILSTASVPAEAKKRAVSTPAAPQVRIVATIAGSLSALAESPAGIVFAGSVAGVLTSSGEAKVLATNVWATSVVTAGDATVWFVESDTLRRVGPSGQLDTFPVRYSARNTSLIHGPDGNLWFAESAKDRLGRSTIDGTIHELALPPALAAPAVILRGTDGAVLVAGRRAVGRVVADDVYAIWNAESSGVFAGRAGSAGFGSLTQTADGTVWLGIATESRSSGFSKGGAIVRMTPSGDFDEVVRLPFFESPAALTAGRDGSLWFVTYNDYLAPAPEQTLHRRRPDGTVQQYSLPRAGWANGEGMRAAALLCDASGTIWIALNAVSGGAAIARLDAD
jgi:streptogramin lyase